MKSLVALRPDGRTVRHSAMPSVLLRCLAIARRQGYRVSLVDCGRAPLDFGLLADSLTQSGASEVWIYADRERPLSAYRLGRFAREVLPEARVTFLGTRCSEFPSEAFDHGCSDLVVVSDPYASVEALVNSADPRSIPGVLCATPTLAPADSRPKSLWHGVPAPQFDLLGSGVGGQACLGLDTSRADGASLLLRATELVKEDLNLIAERGASVEFQDDDFFARPDVSELTEWLDRRGLAWKARTRASTLQHLSLEALHLNPCRSLVIDLDIEPARLAPIVDRAESSGLDLVYEVEAFRPGETIDCIRDLGAVLYGPSRPRVRSAVRGRFHLGSEQSGWQLSSSWAKRIESLPSFLPYTLLTQFVCLDDRHRMCARSVAYGLSRIERWVDDRFFLTQGEGSQGSLQAFVSYTIEVAKELEQARMVADYLNDGLRLGQSVAARIRALCALALLDCLRSTQASDGLPRMAVMERTLPVRFAVDIGETASAKNERMDVQKKDQFFCSRPWTGFEVGTEDGGVHMCCWDKQPYGNVNENSIEEIWNGERIKFNRRMMAAGRWEAICQAHCPYIAGWMGDSVPDNPKGDAFKTNIGLNLQEIEQRAITVESNPRYWKIGHSTLCNLDCVMCYQDRNSKEVLPDSFYEDFSRYYPSIQELLILGGEPLMIKRVRHLLRDFPRDRAPDAHFALITNGTFYDENTLALVERHPISWVVISVDAATPKTYSHIRRKGDFGHTLEGIRTWKRFSDRAGFPLVLSFTVMRDNLEELAEFVQLAQDVGVDCQFSPVEGNFGGQDRIDRAKLESEVERALAVVRRSENWARLEVASRSLNSLVRNS